jgi:hypothetical protein
LSSRFARVRIRVAQRDYWLPKSRPAEWLLIEWPDSEKEPINIGCQRFQKMSRSVSSLILPGRKRKTIARPGP